MPATHKSRRTIVGAILPLSVLLLASVLAEDFNIPLCPSMCKCNFLPNSLEYLTDCRGQRLKTLPDNINLQVGLLDLSNNLFNSIPEELSKYEVLKELFLAHNNIVHLDEFSLNTSSLEKLDLSYNNITEWGNVHYRVLNLTGSLKELVLSHNNIRHLDMSRSLISTSLEVLRMQNCSLTNIPIMFLVQLKNIKELILSENKLTVLPTLQSSSLITLDVSACRITETPRDALENLPALKLLLMSNNEQLKTFKVVNSNSVQHISLTLCNIEYVNLGGFSNLVFANLSGNRINRILERHFRNDKLKTLDLSDNSIKSIDGNAFLGLRSLEVLNLSSNIFSDLRPETFAKNKKLTVLNLSRTYLTEMIHFHIPALQTLDLSFNEIQQIEEKSLTFMPLLRTLRLSRNLITNLPNKIYSGSLNALDLSLCHVITIKNETFIHLTNLQTLNIAGNRLTGLRSHIFPRNIREVMVENNPWRCECFSKEFRQLYDFLTGSPAKISRNKLICQSPENVSGHPWHQACAYVWHESHVFLGRSDRLWLYIISMVLAMSVIICATLSIKRVYQVKLQRQQEEQREQRRQAQERLRRLRVLQQREREEAQQNAPDPRDLVRPPSYAEAIRMPRIDGSYSSLAGSRPSIGTSNPDLSKRNSDVQARNAINKQNANGRGKNNTKNRNTDGRPGESNGREENAEAPSGSHSRHGAQPEVEQQECDSENDTARLRTATAETSLLNTHL